jgi:hypothetical protein
MGSEQSKMKPKQGQPLAIKDNALTVDESKALQMFGSKNDLFNESIVHQLVNVVAKGREPTNAELGLGGSMMAGIAPSDELEGMLALQMVAIHNATITFARRLAHVETIAQQDSAEKALNKLTRTFTMQMAALQKHRSGGKQKVIVKHVHVNEGGQAIVGNVQAGDG